MMVRLLWLRGGTAVAKACYPAVRSCFHSRRGLSLLSWRLTAVLAIDLAGLIAKEEIESIPIAWTSSVCSLALSTAFTSGIALLRYQPIAKDEHIS